MKKQILLIILLLSLSASNFAQKTSAYKSPEQEYKLAQNLFNKEMYSAAFELFTEVANKLNDKNTLLYADCKFHIAMCSYELLNNDAEYLLSSFIKDFPENASTIRAEFLLANLYYRDRKYSKAQKLYSEIDINNLSTQERHEYNFKYGYSAYMQSEYVLARSRFSQVKDTDSHYSVAATYYFAHIAYTDKNYATALEHFRKVQNDASFGPIVPYYIVQILYFQRKFDELIEYAKPLANNKETRRMPEILRLLGEANFAKRNYREAAVYFEQFQNSTTERLSNEDYYKIAYVYYMTNNYPKAIDNFQKSIGANDTISQNAHYHMGDAFLKQNNKSFARTAFLQAHKLNVDPILSEEALFIFAKLSIELSQNPYNEAIIALQEYIRTYPDNRRVDEAYEYLVNLYMQTRNYREALISLEKIKSPNEKINEAHQRIAFFRAIELFNDRNYPEAIKAFNSSLKYPLERNLRAEAIFWIAESYYSMNKIDSALINYNLFLQSPGAVTSRYYNHAQYNIAYCHFNKKNYGRALTAFRIFTEKHTTKDPIFYDAHIRLGDTYYALGRYAEASASYNVAVQPGVAFADYALLQRANSKGAIGNHKGKIDDLELFLKNYPNSTHRTNVIFELANTNLMIENEDKAISYYKEIVNNHPNSSFHVKSMLKIGLTLYNQGKNEEALAELKKVVKQYQGSSESQEALDVISKIYTDMNQVEEFFTYVKDISGTSLTVVSQDTMTYVAAENAFMKGDCMSARPALRNYIQNFPSGTFILNAHFYAAECDFQTQKFDDALKSYRFVINRPWSRFSETSMLKAARISNTLENWKDAIIYFKSLEEKAENVENITTARMGLMRSYYRNNQFNEAINAAQKVIETQKNNQDHINEANSVLGVSAFKIEDYTQANAVFNKQKLLKSEFGAEAFYYLALINYEQSKYNESEKLIFELINKLPSYEYWIAKSFILLADNYVATGNIFQAKHTLKSLISNYEGKDLVDIAKAKLAEIERNENLSKETQIIEE